MIRGILDSLAHEVAVIDEAGKVLAVNERWLRFGRENGVAPGANSAGVDYLGAIRPAAAAGDPVASAVLEGLLALLAGKRRDFTLEYPCQTPDRMLWFVMHAARTDWRPGAVVISHTDITERVEAEQRLLEATEKLREADTRKDEFIATLAHELRNPLTPIKNAAYLLRRQLPDFDKKERSVALLSMVDRQTTHLLHLVDDLLDLSRISCGKIGLKRETVDLREILRHSVEVAQRNIEMGAHKLEVSLPETPMSVYGDPVRLAQVFANLLDNAAKYTQHGGAIRLSAEPRGAEAVVLVSDNGLGIPADMLPRIFDLFTQVDRKIARPRGGGLGIGLALVKRLLELHGGTIEAHSEGPGKGSSFIVRLPAVARGGAETAQGSAPHELRTTLRVLVIEDNRDVAESLQMLLETAGAMVRAAYDGATGLDMLTSFNPDIVLLDLDLPGMDGYETARLIRASPQGRGVKLVALTGWGPEQAFERVRAAGFDRLITKPASLRALQQLFDEA
ncbi:hybrid sensor histidine kinase/response regulator [Methylocystis heyeri]|uniref:histidine kinase n=1 Tax=Methylocystis heyeri TaxID=391905 RepID=A0A6B8KKM1_9HYPH|nr:ATP-binding protein [Methylocystis heyeri]QGM47230.1 response regulator [Methylocystis heyeri]